MESGTQLKTLVFPLTYCRDQLPVSSLSYFPSLCPHLQLGLSRPFRCFQELTETEKNASQRVVERD